MARTAIPAKLDHFNVIKTIHSMLMMLSRLVGACTCLKKAAGIPVLPAHLTCADPRSFVRGGPTLTTFFFS